jgi:hypothetical protein
MLKLLLRLWPILALSFCPLRAADDGRIAGVRAADDERVAAMLAGDSARLTAVLSGGLRYVHTSGHVDTKASYITARITPSTAYDRIDYLERNFLPADSGVVLMYGHVLIHSLHGTKNSADLDFLAVWRNENGSWRLLAWQSTPHKPLAAPSAAPPAK